MSAVDRAALNTLLGIIVPPAPDAWLLTESLIGDRWLPAWCPASSDRFVELAHTVGERWETRVGLTARRGRNRDLTHDCTALWAVVDTGNGVRALERMRPRPTLVLQEGGTLRRTAIWALAKPLAWEWTIRANRRIAHHLGGPKKFVGPAHAVHMPSTFKRDGRVVPLPIVVAEHNPQQQYLARDVVQYLRDAPDPDAWRKRSAA